jgi:nitroreductase
MKPQEKNEETVNEKIDHNLDEDTRIAPPDSGAPFNTVEDTIYRRRSVRVYRKKQVPQYLIRRILEAGRFAPSSGNAQTWKFIVVRDRQMIQEMTDDIVAICQKGMKFVDYTRPGKKRREWLVHILQKRMPSAMHPIPFFATRAIAKGSIGVWHGAPTVILILADKRCPGKPQVDVGIAGQNMVLTAHSLGLGTCWVGFVEAIAKSAKWKKHLSIQYPYELQNSIAVGYPKGSPDGYVERETQAIDWYSEDGGFSVKY